MNTSSLSSSSSIPDVIMTAQSPCPTDRIVAAYHRGVFKPYEHFLGKSRGWDSSRLETLKEIVKKKDVADVNNKLSTRLMYLFTFVIEPHTTDEQKQEEISAYISQLEPDSQNSLLYLLTKEEAELSMTILKHCNKQIREEVYRNGLKYQSVKCYETFFYNIFKVMIHISWTAQDKKTFLDDMFSLLPPQTGDDLIYYFLKETPDKEQDNFSNVCSADLSTRIKNLKTEVIQYSLTKLQEVKLLAERIDPNFKGNKNKFYLDFFYYQIKDDANADLFAIGFDENDWKYLSHKLEKNVSLAVPSFASLTMNWMIKVSQRLKEDENFVGNAKKNDSGLWLFYHHAAKFVDKYKGCRGITEQDYARLGQAQNPLFLPRFFNAFDTPAQCALVKHSIQQEPKNLLAWIDAILLNKSNWRDERSDKLDNIFGVISKIGQMDSALEILYSANSSSIFMNNKSEIDLYCSLDHSYQQSIMKHILRDKDDGLRRLASWIAVIADSEKSKQGIFEKNFYKNLKEINPTYPLELKNILQHTLKPLAEIDVLIDDLLPIDSELLPPEEKQKRAITKLKQHFTTPNFPHVERRRFVKNLDKDLRLENEDPSAFVEKLFKEIPPDAWPLIFLHFDSILSNTFYDAYFEEKSRGGMSKKQRREAPPLMEITQKDIPINEFAKDRLKQIVNDPENARFGDLFTWYNVMLATEPFLDGTPPPKKGFKDPNMLVDVCALTLLKMTGNPLLKDKEGGSPAGWAMQHLYQVACEKNALHLIIQRFMEIAPVEKFIPTMEKFSSSCFNYNRDGLKQLIADCFEGGKVDKIEYISTCLLAYHKSGKGYSEIASSLLAKPIISNDAEIASIGKQMLQSMGVQFLSYFFRREAFNSTIIKALKKADPDYCEILFLDLLSVLTQATNGPKEKLCMFQNFIEAYTYAGYDLLTLLSDRNVAALIPTIKTWYEQEDCLEIIDPSLSSLTLLRYFRENALYGIVLNQIRKSYDKKHPSFYALDDLLTILSKMGCKEEFISKLIETDPKFLEFIKNKIKEDIVKCLELCYGDLGHLVLEWVPDWKERLIVWAKDKIQKNKQESMQYGHDEPGYYDIVRMYQALERAGVLDIWLVDLHQALSGEMQKDIDSVYAKFIKKKKEVKTE